MYSSSCNHGSGKWVPPRWVSFKLGQWNHHLVTLLQIPKKSCKWLFIIATSPWSPFLAIRKALAQRKRPVANPQTKVVQVLVAASRPTPAGNSFTTHETLGKTVLKWVFSFKMQCQVPEDWRMIWSKCQFWTQISISAVIPFTSLNKNSTNSRSLKTQLGAMALQLIPLGVNSGLVGDLLKCFCPNFVMPHQPRQQKTSKTPETLLYFLLLYLKFPRFIKPFKYWRKHVVTPIIARVGSTSSSLAFALALALPLA